MFQKKEIGEEFAFQVENIHHIIYLIIEMQDFLDTLTISSPGNSAFRDTGEEWEPLSKT